MKTQKSTIVWLVALVAALVVLGYFIFQTSSLQTQINDLKTQVSASALNLNDLNITLTNADRFSSKLHDLLQEHTFLLIDTIRRSTNPAASYPDSLTALQNNINEVGTLLTPIYGTNSQQLVNLWNTKVNIFLNYSTAVKNSDPNANTQFASDAAGYEEAVATFWASTNNPYPTFDKATMKQYTTNNMNNVKAAVDAWNAKDYPGYFSDLHTAYTQMGTYADVISQGIISQNQNYFLQQ